MTTQPLLADKTSGDFRYTESNGGVTITDFTDSRAFSVVIPGQIGGKPVTGIGKGAFYNRQNLTRITIPGSVTHIGEDAFFNCIGLMDLALPVSLTTVGNGAFMNCESLLEVAVPSSVTSLGSGAFQACRRLERVSLSANLSMINRYCFVDCIALAEVTIPGKVAKIGEYAFRGCGELKTVKFPGTLEIIGNNAFSGCVKLSAVKLPDGLAKIENSAFRECLSITSLIIPSSVTSVEYGAFMDSRHLTKITFLGDAPEKSGGIFYALPSDFVSYHLEGKSGFTTPNWQGYPCEVTTLAPEIEVRESAALLVDGKSKESFGTTALSGAGRTKVFKIRNGGTANLTGLAIKIGGLDAEDFKVSGLNTKSLPINGTTTFKVTFKPTAAGSREAEIHISGNQTSADPFDIKLAGMGVK